jgi:hypothetical protein
MVGPVRHALRQDFEAAHGQWIVWAWSRVRAAHGEPSAAVPDPSPEPAPHEVPPDSSALLAAERLRAEQWRESLGVDTPARRHAEDIRCWEAGAWLQAVPTYTGETIIGAETFRRATGARLVDASALPEAGDATCCTQCRRPGEDRNGWHALGCCHSLGAPTYCRHDVINRHFVGHLVAAGYRPTSELTLSDIGETLGCSASTIVAASRQYARDTGNEAPSARPTDLFVRVWPAGPGRAACATSFDTSIRSAQSSAAAGTVGATPAITVGQEIKAKAAAALEMLGVACVPLVFSTNGRASGDTIRFMQEVGQRKARVMGIPLAQGHQHLVQATSCALQRANGELLKAVARRLRDPDVGRRRRAAERAAGPAADGPAARAEAQAAVLLPEALRSLGPRTA